MSEDCSIPLPPALIEQLAEQVAHRLADRISPPPEEWVTAERAAEHMACGRERVYELASRGEIPFGEDGRRKLFRLRDLDAYITRKA
jgi:excisionase family DNA binding protein